MPGSGWDDERELAFEDCFGGEPKGFAHVFPAEVR
jgi:hypothetical protein